MSDPDATLVNNDEALRYMQELLGTQTDADQQATAEVNPSKILPMLKLPSGKEGTNLSILINGEPVPMLSGRKYLTVMILGLAGSRVLFPPQAENSKIPVCGTGLQDLGALKRDETYGQWASGENREARACRGCDWNQFNSEHAWDEKKDGKGKACKESRTMVLAIMEQGQKLPLADEQVNLHFYNFADVNSIAEPLLNPQGLVLCQFPYGSNAKLLQGMQEVAMTRRLPLSRMIWRLSAEKNEKGQFVWCSYKAEFVGVAHPAIVRGDQKPHLDAAESWWESYVINYGRAVQDPASLAEGHSKPESEQEDVGF